MTETPMFFFEGGLTTDTSKLALAPGAMLNPCQNYEVSEEGGYTLTGHYERFDGRVKPSAAMYTLIEFDTGTAEIADGDTVTGSGTGASGIALITGVVSSGSYVGGDAAGYVVLWVTSGTFLDTDDLEVGGIPLCAATTVYDAGTGAASEALDKAWTLLAAAEARALIGAVPGSGRILGVWSYKGVVYAFRNNAGDTAAVMHKSTSTGWQAVTLNKEISFDTGAVQAFTVGGTLTGGITGHTATIKSCYISSGTFAGGNAVGVMTLAGETGVFQVGEALTDGTATAVCTVIATTPTLVKDGYYEFDNYNFTGAADTLTMFGVDGVNLGFSFDGTNFVRIRTGMTTDTPKHLAAHRGYLMYSFRGSLQISPLGSNGNGIYGTWTVLSGSSEIGIGDEITGLESTVNGTLIIFARNSVDVLYGSTAAGGSDPWVRKTLSKSFGAKEWTIQNTITPMFISDAGLSVLPDTADFGEFNGETISGAVQTVINSYKDTITCSVAFRNKNQYRLFFSNGDGLVAKFKNGQLIGYSMMSYRIPVQCATASIRSDRYLSSGVIETDHIYFGSDGTDGGYVYQMDAGTSQDGENITAFFRLPYNHFNTPRIRKQFRRVVIEVEVEGGGTATIGYQPDFKMFDSTVQDSDSYSITTEAQDGYWNQDFWNQFYWAQAGADEFYEVRIQGVGCGLSGTISYNGNDSRMHTIRSMIVHYDYRSMRR